jgi:tRNA (guanine26-N2/guanine27-N2)-dimethyltransferase
MEVNEGEVIITVPEVRDGASEGTGSSVFYNPTQELNRDITVATLRAYRARQPQVETYLDAMMASGIRGVRAATAGFQVSGTDTDSAAVQLARENFARNNVSGDLRQADANVAMHQTRYDIVDLDPFGTPAPYLDAALANTAGLVCVTATDTAPLCGAHQDSGIRSYGAVPQNTEYHPEMGLRTLLSAIIRTAARHDRAAVPILSHVSRHYVRTYVEIEASSTAANERIASLGYIYHCEDCLHRDAETSLIAHPPSRCAACSSERILTAGPVYVGKICDPEFVAAVCSETDSRLATANKARRILSTIQTELDTPTHYDQHRLCKLWGRSASAMDDFLEDLHESGHSASRAHYSGTAFKTTASITEIRSATGS